RRRMAQQRGDEVVNRRFGDRVIVVQDEDHREVEIDQIVAEGGAEDRRRRQPWGTKEVERRRADAGNRRLERCYEVGDECPKIAVVFVEREPGRREAAICQPLAQQRRLAESGGPDDEEQRKVETRRQRL